MLSALYFVGNKKFVFNYSPILYLVVTFKVYDYSTTPLKVKATISTPTF